jgi:hypothetical protein
MFCSTTVNEIVCCQGLLDWLLQGNANAKVHPGRHCASSFHGPTDELKRRGNLHSSREEMQKCIASLLNGILSQTTPDASA